MFVWPRAARSLLQYNAGPGASVPPTLIFMLGYLGGLIIHLHTPLVLVQGGPIARAIAGVAGVAVAALGLGLVVWAWRTMTVERTGIMFQHAATRLVERGPFRWSRNPMYVAFVATYAGLALAANSAWPFVLLPFIMICLERFVIDREERYLRRTFGESYRAYCGRVNRYLTFRRCPATAARQIRSHSS